MKMPTVKKTNTIIKLENDKLPIIDMLIKTLEGKGNKTSWDSDGTLFTCKLKNKGTILITFPKEFTGKFKVEYDKKGGVIYKEIEFKASQDITESDVKKSIFKTIPKSSVVNGAFYLGKNIMIFKELEKWFKKLNIENVSYSGNLNINFGDNCMDKLTLVLNPYDGSSNSSNIDTGKVTKPYKKLKGYSEGKFYGIELVKMPTEKCYDIKINNTNIGYYHKDRNLILLNFNPFANLNLKNTGKLKDNEYLTKVMKDLSDAISSFKCKTIDVTEFKMKQMIVNFTSGAKNSLKKMVNSLTAARNEIQSYEQSLTSLYKKCVTYNKEIEMVSKVDETNIETFMAEINKVKKQPIITNVTTDDGTLNITFKETTVKAHVGRTNRSSNYTSGPIYEYYIGEITAHIYGNGKITVTSNCDNVNTAHPHVNESKKPCLGSGDGPNMMHKLIGEMNFSDFIYVFWMWIKRWRPEDCYVKPYIMLDDKLSRGYPVFDQTGKRIKFDDKDLIKKGILNEGLKKHKDYDKNIEKFKSFKPQA